MRQQLRVWARGLACLFICGWFFPGFPTMALHTCIPVHFKTVRTLQRNKCNLPIPRPSGRRANADRPLAGRRLDRNLLLWHCEVPGPPEQPGRCDRRPGPPGAGWASCTRSRPRPRPPSAPASSGVAHLRPLAALGPRSRGAVRLKAGWLDVIPHVSSFISLSLAYTASVCFYEYFTSPANVYFISLLNVLNINAATTLP